MKFIMFSVSLLIFVIQVSSQSPDSENVDAYSLMVKTFVEINGLNYGIPIEIPGLSNKITQLIDKELPHDAVDYDTSEFNPYARKLLQFEELYPSSGMLSLRLLEQRMKLPKGTFDRLLSHIINHEPSHVVVAYRILGELGLDQISTSNPPFTSIDPEQHKQLTIVFDDDYPILASEVSRKFLDLNNSPFLKDRVVGIQVLDLLSAWVLKHRMELNLAPVQFQYFLARIRSFNYMYFASFTQRFKMDYIILVGESKHLNWGGTFCTYQLPLLRKIHSNDWYTIKTLSKQKLSRSGPLTLSNTDFDSLGSNFRFIIDENELSDIVREKKAHKLRHFSENHVMYPFRQYDGQLYGFISPEHYDIYKMRSFELQGNIQYNAIFMKRKGMYFTFEAWSNHDDKMFEIKFYGISMENPSQVGDELNRAWEQFQMHFKDRHLSILEFVHGNVDQYRFGENNRYMAKVLLQSCDN